ncbi:hypothetical protein EYF80_053028 [Liparis tanakae]|uniref:Uncharacterized protein n=1 Tax=Liparis tanakae TaxID=230148 RepID=A0A4Z2F6R2_9TELE|nr:hypothetical protein EYF80_053028 [Liparis tanakae]
MEGSVALDRVPNRRATSERSVTRTAVHHFYNVSNTPKGGGRASPVALEPKALLCSGSESVRRTPATEDLGEMPVHDKTGG